MKFTQVDHAKNGTLTSEMEQVVKTEGIDEDTVLSNVANGSLVVMVRNDVALLPLERA